MRWSGPFSSGAMLANARRLIVTGVLEAIQRQAPWTAPWIRSVSSSATTSPVRSRCRWLWSSPVTNVVLAIDRPGVEWSSIDIDAKERSLTIRATRGTRTADGLQWLLRERPTGTLVRRLTLRKGVALDKAEAVHASGVLTVRMPVADEAKPRKIAVSHVDSGWVIGGRVEPTS